MPSALVDRSCGAAKQLQSDRVFGRDGWGEPWDHGDPVDTARNDAMAELAAAMTDLRATHNVHYATPSHASGHGDRRVTSRRSLDELDPWLRVTGAICAWRRAGSPVPALSGWSKRLPRSGGQRRSILPWLRHTCRRSHARRAGMAPRSARCSTYAISSSRAAATGMASGHPPTKICRCVPGRGAPSTTSST